MSETPAVEAMQAAAKFLNDVYAAAAGIGRHEGHSLEQVGRCVYCSCGLRWQGRKPTEAERQQILSGMETT